VIAGILAAAGSLGVLAFHVVSQARGPQRIREELTLVEGVFGPIPDDATECVLELGIVMDGSDGDLTIRTPSGLDHRKMSWQRRRPPEAICEMRSMKWTYSSPLGENGVARWNQELLGYRKRKE